ncbi:hypothetical protein EZV62_018417 [Acer yangbiense]|uniref:Leucine-rich repeat-containing N-terminal plant-type domain-containing protein n=1 Tax=Acer yangbiense TaxID=1000413 RepID=A0A5C7HJS3_9ROSI|nr:hypothetical protein EZV62_018417 [Acer yangbiense]
MTYLTEIWLHGNSFIGPIPDLSGLGNLNHLSLRDNQLSGIIPSILVNHPKLAIVNLTYNFLQRPTPKFDTSKVEVDIIAEANVFCLDAPDVACDDCTISPNFSKFPSLSLLFLKNNSLTGTIPDELISLSNLKRLDVSGNNLSGKLPNFRPDVFVNTTRNPNIG